MTGTTAFVVAERGQRPGRRLQRKGWRTSLTAIALAMDQWEQNEKDADTSGFISILSRASHAECRASCHRDAVVKDSSVLHVEAPLVEQQAHRNFEHLYRADRPKPTAGVDCHMLSESRHDVGNIPKAYRQPVGCTPDS